MHVAVRRIFGVALSIAMFDLVLTTARCASASVDGGNAPTTRPSTAPATKMTTGMTGIVLIGSSGGGRRADTWWAPYAAKLIIRDSHGDIAAIARSDDNGRFAVALPEGEYVLEPESHGIRPPRATAQRVKVVHGKVSEVTVRFDTGVR